MVPKGFEIVIIIIIILVLFGPKLIPLVSKQIKETGKAAKKAVENGADAAGVDLQASATNPDGTKKDIVDRINEFQDKIDDRMNKRPDIDDTTSELETVAAPAHLQQPVLESSEEKKTELAGHKDTKTPCG